MHNIANAARITEWLIKLAIGALLTPAETPPSAAHNHAGPRSDHHTRRNHRRPIVAVRWVPITIGAIIIRVIIRSVIIRRVEARIAEAHPDEPAAIAHKPAIRESPAEVAAIAAEAAVKGASNRVTNCTARECSRPTSETAATAAGLGEPGCRQCERHQYKNQAPHKTPFLRQQLLEPAAPAQPADRST